MTGCLLPKLMLIKFAHPRFLLRSIIWLFVTGYLWCFLNLNETNSFCPCQNLHIVVFAITILMILLSTVLLSTLGKILPGFTLPVIEPPRSLLA